ncbi:MAG: alpha/beta hydrolase [Gemmataceae bacterium]
MIWILLGTAILCSVPGTMIVALILLHYVMRWKYLHHVVRIFQEKPLFIIPIGQPIPDAEDVRLTTADGLQLRGCYLHAPRPRRGVILFGLEFGSNRWACLQYCDHLLAAGYDIFTFEYRGQGDSDKPTDYVPMQWVTDYEVRDFKAALEYLKKRPDRDPRGVGFFGISKGGGAGLLAAVDDPFVRCFVTDGIFATYSTVVPYMRKWFGLYNHNYLIQDMLPYWYYGTVAKVGLRWIEQACHCHFPYLEKAIARLQRPLLMIHGGNDTYIRPVMAQVLFDQASEPKELWIVPDAKHNQALHLAGDEYRCRVRFFFDQHLAGDVVEEPPPGTNGVCEKKREMVRSA